MTLKGGVADRFEPGQAYSSAVGRLLRQLVRWAMLGARPAIYPKLPTGYVPPAV